mmetsp:Transcript_78934/g.228154  ORF Transcript_78934/g.228154 Transcript_78934/m.228154 type:complete len:268 (-) Transcript_78934:590-1393(-)
MTMRPTGAVTKIENTAVVKISVPMVMYFAYFSGSSLSSSVLRAMSRGTEPSAAWTVAFGIQANAINKRSLKRKPAPKVAKYAAQTRKATPMMMRHTALGMVAAETLEKSRAAPMMEKRRGSATALHTLQRSSSTSCAAQGNCPLHMKPPTPFAQNREAPAAMTREASAPAPAKWASFDEKVNTKPSSSKASERFTWLSQTFVALRTKAPRRPKMVPPMMLMGPCNASMTISPVPIASPIHMLKPEIATTSSKEAAATTSDGTPWSTP